LAENSALNDHFSAGIPPSGESEKLSTGLKKIKFHLHPIWKNLPPFWKPESAYQCFFSLMGSIAWEKTHENGNKRGE
jgi:hypothetical protein